MFEDVMGKKNNEDLTIVLYSRKDYSQEAYNAAISEAKKRGLNVKIDEIEGWNKTIKTYSEIQEKNEKHFKRENWSSHLIIGTLILVAGAGFSIASYLYAAPGKTYVVTTGAIIYGIYHIFTGIDYFFGSR